MATRGVVVGFVLSLVVSVAAAVGEEDGDQGAPAEPATGGPARAGMPSLDGLSQTRDRPLFRPDRRPLEVPASADEEAAGPALSAPGEAAFAPKLVGIVTGPDLDIALLRPSAGGAIVRLRPDDDLEGWRLDRIEARSVVFRKDDREVTIAIRQPRSAAATGEPEVIPPEPESDH